MRHTDFVLHPSDAPHIAKLTKAHSEVLALFRENPNYEAMAAALGINIGTVKSRLHRARTRVLNMRLRAAAAKQEAA